MPEITKKPGYGVLVVRCAWKESRDEIRSHARVTIVTLAASLILGLSTGGAVQGGLIGSLIGAVGAPTLIGVGLYLWKLINAPAVLHRQQERETEGFKMQSEQLRGELVRSKDLEAPTPLVTVEVAISKAAIALERHLENGRCERNVLALEVHVSVSNRLDQAITIRPKALMLLCGEREVPAEWIPRMFIDRVGKTRDYSNFPEGQHATEPYCESETFFWFDAVPYDPSNPFWAPDLEVLVTIAVPEPIEPVRKFRLPLPPRIYSRF